ncbi:GNAT family N-acetyltransferase [Nonomuraea rubra]|uniref:Ribosomal protein S18 acetylase RimI-like enzyme n=1 Tax=Nonomuraea rubra TaxID=46180 RepID=A0A7X0P0W4_9ACTN|nr:GNAT family N-acetyltransferase [Nonomuraea rubra]MBB6553220.1 ribosomal protein S18 acetylase RimI-like enzyme [Nonomuraea rubra]
MPATPAWSELGPRGQAGAATFEIRIVPVNEVDGLLVAVAEVAAQVFTRPPWAEPRQSAYAVAERLAADTLRPGFALAVAFHDDQVHGFAYGVRCSRLALLASRLPRGDITLRELAVSPSMQGHGLGVRLHDALLSASPGTSWWLSTHPRAGAALGLYRRRGWRVAALLNAEDDVRLIMLKQPPSRLGESS